MSRLTVSTQQQRNVEWNKFHTNESHASNLRAQAAKEQSLLPPRSRQRAQVWIACPVPPQSFHELQWKQFLKIQDGNLKVVLSYELTTLQTVLIKFKVITYEILAQTPAVFVTMHLQDKIIEVKMMVCFLWILLVYLHCYWFSGAQRNL